MPGSPLRVNQKAPHDIVELKINANNEVGPCRSLAMLMQV